MAQNEIRATDGMPLALRLREVLGAAGMTVT